MSALQIYLDFVMNYAPYFYYLPDQGVVDPEWGRGPAPASFAVEFLSEAYKTKEFESQKSSILNKIVELADYLLSIQCSDQARLAYEGFKSKDESTYYYAVDAMRAVSALLKAYDLSGSTGYFEAAKLAAGTFLYNMQHKPSQLGIHDKYYGGFAQAVTIADAWIADMHVVDIYGVDGLKDLHVRTGEAKYQTMIDDALGFYRSGFESLYLKYSPKPYGDSAWHRTGLQENQIYDDDFAYALYALFRFEGWSATVKRVYESINAVGPCSEYPAYNPAVCWAGYVDVVNRKPACQYYDMVTAGILYEIRNIYNVSSLEKSINTILSKPDACMYWGVKFADFSPVENKKSTITVSWIGRLLMGYSPHMPTFARILRAHGEQATIYSRIEQNGKALYVEGGFTLAVVSPAQANEILIEPGYASNDYIRIFFATDVKHRDKIVLRGQEYEVGPVEEHRFRDRLMYRTAICRRLIQ